jgi:hypothetical protein
MSQRLRKDREVVAAFVRAVTASDKEREHLEKLGCAFDFGRDFLRLEPGSLQAVAAEFI